MSRGVVGRGGSEHACGRHYICKVAKQARVQVEGLRLPQAAALCLRILSSWRLPLQLLALTKALLPPRPRLRWVVDSAHRERVKELALHRGISSVEQPAAEGVLQAPAAIASWLSPGVGLGE